MKIFSNIQSWIGAMVSSYVYQHNSADKWSGFYKKIIKSGLKGEKAWGRH